MWKVALGVAFVALVVVDVLRFSVRPGGVRMLKPRSRRKTVLKF